ncbi:MAG: HugZ family protein [Acidimicrobiales bacterium]
MTTGHVIPGWEPEGDGAQRDGPAVPPPPEPSHAERARTLVAGQSRGALSTIALEPAGTPFGSVVTYGLDPSGRPAFFVSTLAEHTRNLDADARASMLVVEDTPAGADPLASGRVTLLGTVAEVAYPDERARARSAYLEANPAAFYVDYGDFRCLRLEVTGVRYVGGFGRMSWVDPRDYAIARPDPLVSAGAGIVAHMNTDHPDALVALCRHQGGRPDVESASMTAVDRYGFEVVATRGEGRLEALRIGFRSEQVAPDAVRAELIAMLAEVQTAVMSDQEVPGPDAFEQTLPAVDEEGGLDPPSPDPEAPEADAVEQAYREPLMDERLP